MSVPNPSQRPRGPSNGAPLGPGGRPVQDQRNASTMSSASGLAQPPRSDRGNAGSPMSRAEKFEDEKKRIIQSCFGKKEPDGSISESYITHIRVEEDSAFPSSPPPLDSSADKKKARVIIVAVRKSGRVRMHKAKENPNTSFSIGKTWNLDDLAVIQSFTNFMPSTPEERDEKQRAGPTGFTVTVQKPYYWSAHTAKEKDFFIFSLIKIFKKYTGGRMPTLVGFSAPELEQFGEGARAISGTPPIPQPNAAAASRVPSQESSIMREPRTPNLPPDISRERRSRPSQERSSQERLPQQRYPSERPPQERQLHSTVSHPTRAPNSNERIHMPGSFPSTDSVNDVNQQPQLRSKRSESPAVLPQPNFRRPGPGQSTDSFRSGQESFESSRSSNERPRPNGSYSSSNLAVNAAEDRSSNTVKDIRGPSPLSQQQGSVEPPPKLNSDPPIAGRPSGSPSPRPTEDRRNGHRRERSASSKSSNQAPRGTPLSHQIEVNGEHNRDEPTPTTVANKDPLLRQATPETKPSSTSIPNDATQPESQPPSSTYPPTPPPEPPAEEVHRPGLGPMIKSKKSNTEVASKFRKAATAYNAFKPRAGAVTEKPKEENANSGDGITAVFQAPSLLRAVTQDDSRPTTPKDSANTRPSTPEAKKEMPIVNVTTSPLKPTTLVPAEPQVQDKVEPPEVPPPIPDKALDERRKKRQSDHSAKYAKALGINHSLLEGRTFEVESVLNDFGWGSEMSQRKGLDDMENGLRKELARVEAGSWLGTVENNDDRAVAVGDMMDRVIAECEELDCLLTLYNVELGTLSEDVAYIEAQSQGLQVQTANQKLLQTELRNLLDTISITSSQLQILRDASLTKGRGIQDVESTLVQLYTAMLTIDPKLRHNDARPLTADQASLHRSSSTGHGGSELSSMNAVREKRESYRCESVDFILRLKQYLSIKFRETEAKTLDALERKRNNKGSGNATKLDHNLRDIPKKDLWSFSPLMLFTREIDPTEWDELLRLYESCAKRPYQDEFRDNAFAWKRITRKPTTDDSEVLFTTQEREAEGLVGRKLTVKRSKTVRADGTSRISSGDKPNDGKVTAYEAFAGALSEMARLTFVEQNFIVELFHASSLDTQDFFDAVATDPDQRNGRDLIVKKPFDPDRTMAKKVLSVMEEIYSFWPSDLQNLVEWATKQDPLNSIGVLFALESQMSEVEETNQEFLIQAVTKVHDRVSSQLARFFEEQIRGIEDTKVKIKKRKGVISFMKTFPNFSMVVENMLPPTRSLDHLPIRGVINDAYQQINKTMFESLKFIARESPTATQAQTIPSGDPEDKEALNYHILLIENMNHYVEEVAIRNNPVLEDWNFRARAEMNEHMELYLAAVIRRPLGKLLDFLESTESALRNNPGSPASVATRASHSRSTFKKILSNYDAKEIKRGIETLKKRVEKHFGEGDDTPGLSRELILKVYKECEARYLDVGERVNKIVTEVYEGSLEVEWKREDVVSAFKK
ncbi:hypothetical protein ACLMJK_005567 [Lecanora helva]